MVEDKNKNLDKVVIKERKRGVGEVARHAEVGEEKINGIAIRVVVCVQCIR